MSSCALRRFRGTPILAVLALLGMTRQVGAQGDVAAGDSAPRFLLASTVSGERVKVEASAVPLLRRRVSLALDDATVTDALKAIGRQAGVSLIYEPSRVTSERRVRVHADGLTVAAALTEVLFDSGLDVLVSDGRHLAIVPRHAPVAPDTGAVSGRVTDAKTGVAVGGATVVIERTSLSATTDNNGRYRIAEVAAGTYTVLARYIGYAPGTTSVTVSGGPEATADFALEKSAQRLDEIVTTATGDQRKLEVGNVVARIQADSVMQSAPVTNFTDLLLSRVAGAQVLPPDGTSGLSAQIRLRGMNSFSLSNDPLVVVDGVRVGNNPAVRDNPTAFDFIERYTPGRLADIDPEEIESIDIVKGPAAASLYGTDAANGVIVIKTKRGSPGRTSLDVYSEQGGITPTKRYPDPYYRFGTSTTTGASVRCTLLDQVAGGCRPDSLSHFNPLTDPATSPLSTGYRQVYGAQLSGGVPALTFFTSGEYENERGVLTMPAPDQTLYRAFLGGQDIPGEALHPSGVEKISLRGNVVGKLKDHGELALSAGFVSNDTHVPDIEPVFGSALGSGYRDSFDGWWRNERPANLFGTRNREKTDHFTTSLSGNYQLTHWLAARATGGFDYAGSLFDYLTRRDDGFYGLRTHGQRVNERTQTTLYSFDVGSTASVHLSRGIGSRTTLGAQYNRQNQSETAAYAEGLAPGSTTVDGASLVRNGESAFEKVVAGAFLEEGLSFADRLFLTVAGRVDGASAFGRNFSAAFYPKASVSWLAVGGPTHGSGFLSTLRFRAAYGESGVQPGPLDALRRDTAVTALVNGSAVPGVQFLALGNENLKPERQREIEAGLDADLFRSRVTLELTAYNRQSDDALVAVPFDPSFGITSQVQNIGAVRNRGVEGLIAARVVNARPVTVDLNVNGSYNTNKLLRLAPGVTSVGFLWQQVPGYPLFGIWQPPVTFNDANGDGILEPSEVTVGDTAVFVGSSFPTTDLSIGTTIGLFGGRLQVSGLLNYRGGFKTNNEMIADACFFGSCRAQNDPSAPLSDQAAAIALNSSNFTEYGYIEDGSFWRLRELSLTYTAPPRIARLLGARTASLTLAGRNLALFTHYTGSDPEATANVGTAFQSGAPQYGLSAYWVARVRLGF